MTEYWQRSAVTGSGGDAENGFTETEIVLHRRGEDPIVMACRRNRRLAGCHRFSTATMEAFMQIRTEDARRTREDIPHGGHQGEEWDW